MPAAESLMSPMNGHRGHQPDLREILEYERIVNLHDQIFSGNHPRLKVPQHVIRKVTPRSVQTPPLSGVHSMAAEPVSAPQATPYPRPSSTQSNALPLANGNAGTGTVSATADVASTSAAAAQATTIPNQGGSTNHLTTQKPVSEIDPIFLTKSDDLIRAEIQLQRQRVERTLRDQLEQKKIEYRKRTCFQESKPDFDVSEVLKEAFQLVKPISATDVDGANANTPASDSFDDNSFYSSKAPDSPQFGDQNEQPSPLREEHMRPVEGEDEVHYEGHVDRQHVESAYIDTGDRNMMDVQMQGPSYNVADKRRPSSRSPENLTPRRPSPSRYPIRDQPDMYDEPEYSPPGPDIPSGGRREEEGEYMQEPDINYRRRSYGRPAERGHHARHITPAGHDIRVVRNHITSPAAPQPSRVSPLAVTKVPSLPQSRQQQHTRPTDKLTTTHGSARTSPEVAPQPLKSRKRRRIQENRDKPRVANEGRVADSPDQPYIKPEPISPPPFSDLPLASSRQRPHHERPAYVDISSPRYSPVESRRESGQRRIYEEHADRGYDMGHPIDLSIPRSASRIAYRKPVRDDQNLRRVASFQNARQPEYVHDYPEPPIEYQPRLVRATSYAVTDRPVQPERARYYEETAQPYTRRYISRDMSPPSPRFREPYQELEPEPRAMTQTQRRVVVDADGNRYIEQVATPAPRLQPLATPSGRFSRMEPYNEGPSRMATGSVRAASVMEDPYRDRRYAQDMPPPPVAYRRAPAPEYPREVVRERHVYGREVDERGLVDYAPPPRHATYVEEPFPREDVVRMSSVRPPPSRYEEPARQPLQRMQSVRPSGREISVYVDDEPRPRREYAPVERTGYAAARPVREERYYDDEEAGKMEMDGMQDVVQRVSRRY
ncbi:hypothetical protein AJ78_00190 [Emergomyces pasteurianus Ep9510]|uniref:Uncharacterized protein n=1 Tax=Emergomyces pasteurianus Ep9510 TaxID=1447872 RepID=A0A1J9QUE7_9EURO|nr:hypothetical protein AJ78_00190 [Emergomyces pasteurianus Ep9510]